MAEVRFIKTVTYGGYDKAEVIHRLEHLNKQLFSAKNELRETKRLLEDNKKGKGLQKSIDGIIAEERAKLTEVQVQNDSLSTKLKAAEEDNRKYENEIKKLNASIEELNSKLADANSQLAAAKAADEALALSAVFIEAKKTADMLENSAKEKADSLEKTAAEAAEKSIAYANDEGAVIIYEAQREAAEIIAEAKNKAADMENASDNMRASVLDKMIGLGKQLNSFREALMKFEEEGVGNLYECEEILNKTEETLKEGGIPVFKEPSHLAPEYPDEPKRTADLESEDMKKRKNELDKLRQMAESIGAAKDKKEEAPAAETPEEKAETKKEENGKNNSADEKAPEKKNGGKIDLAALAAQAQALKKK